MMMTPAILLLRPVLNYGQDYANSAGGQPGFESLQLDYDEQGYHLETLHWAAI